MHDFSSLDRGGIPTDLRAVLVLFPLLVLLTIAVAGASVLGIGGVTDRTVLWPLAATGVLVTYYAARIVHVNQCYAGDRDLDPDVRAAARSTRNRWLVWTGASTAVTAFLIANLGLI